jgi:hypothetical protein
VKSRYFYPLLTLALVAVLIGGVWNSEQFPQVQPQQTHFQSSDNQYLNGPLFQQKASFQDNVTIQFYKHDAWAVNIQALQEGWSASCWVGCHGITYTYKTHNKVTNVGINYVQQQMFGSAATTPSAIYIALSSDSGAPAYTDTACTSEISTAGVGRATGSYTPGTPSAGASTNTITHTFTATASVTSAQKGCLFTAISGGTLFADTTFAVTQMNNLDTLNIIWTVVITY